MLRAAVYDIRLLGGVLMVLGAILMLMMAMGALWSMLMHLAVFADAAMLFGPGLWYLFAAEYLKRMQVWPVKVSLRVAAAQVATVLVTIVLAIFGSRREFGMIAAPAIVTVFFIPALIAAIAEMFRARRLIALLESTGRAFEPINVQPLNAQDDVPLPR